MPLTFLGCDESFQRESPLPAWHLSKRRNRRLSEGTDSPHICCSGLVSNRPFRGFPTWFISCFRSPRGLKVAPPKSTEMFSMRCLFEACGIYPLWDCPKIGNTLLYVTYVCQFLGKWWRMTLHLPTAHVTIWTILRLRPSKV